MAKYIQGFAPKYGTITAKFLDAEFTKIAKAHNSHEAADFPPACVPKSGLATDQAYVVLRLFASSVGHGEADTVQDVVVAPGTCTLASVQYVADGVTAAASCDIHVNGVGTIMSGDTTITAAETVYTGTVSSGSITDGNILELHCTTDGAGDLTNITAMLIFKVDLV